MLHIKYVLKKIENLLENLGLQPAIYRKRPTYISLKYYKILITTISTLEPTVSKGN